MKRERGQVYQLVIKASAELDELPILGLIHPSVYNPRYSLSMFYVQVDGRGIRSSKWAPMVGALGTSPAPLQKR